MRRTDLIKIKYPDHISSKNRRYIRNMINFVRDFSLENKLSNIGIACSAGSDSVCLADICHKVSLISGIKFVLIYVNHNLRPKEVINEIEYIQEIGKKYNFPIEICDGSVIHGPNLEARAREVRYNCFKNQCIKHNLQCIFTAHNASEDFETILMHLIEKKFIKTNYNQRLICGIKQISYPYGVKVCHPLLEYKKSDLKNYLEIMNLSWCEDSSNTNVKFKRNFIRHKIIPLIKELNKEI